MFLRVSALSIAGVLIACTPPPTLAQDNQVGPPPEKCRVAPQPDQDKQQQNGNIDLLTTQSLSDKLDECNGVLKPPAVGDSEMTKPPPDTGEMREIRPHELPGQQSRPRG
jgi:hypothetical protein